MSWLTLFRIFPVFSVLRLTFNLKRLNKDDYNSFSDLFSVDLKIVDHLPLNYKYSKGILQVLKLEFPKFRNLEIFLTFSHMLLALCLSFNVCGFIVLRKILGCFAYFVLDVNH